jgi:hypothetical protein
LLSVPVQVPYLSTASEFDDPLRFWTLHQTEAVLVDLNVFKDGYLIPKQRTAAPFSGRPGLIAQIAPVIREILEHKSSATVCGYISSLRYWWQLFDAVETAATKAGALTLRLDTVSGITELHRQHAFDNGMERVIFGNFLRILNLARTVHKLPQLYWSEPEKRGCRQHLPPQWQIDKIRFALKRGWFDAHARWERAEQLLKESDPQTEEEELLFKNYKLFQSTASDIGNLVPTLDELLKGRSYHSFNRDGYSITDMMRGFYPDATDIRMAFHLCLASTGWNPSVLLSLDVTKNFIEAHPKDPTRYLMRGYKARGDTEQITEGLFKSQGSAGVIVKNLIERTAPLRAQLNKELASLKEEYKTLQVQGAIRSELDHKRKEIINFEQGVRSPWLYLAKKVLWLDSRSFSKKSGSSTPFLSQLTEEINKKQLPNKQILLLKAGDFRDAFAGYAYRVSGGMVLYVMKMLGHKSPRTTQIYLNNTLLNHESGRLYMAFSDALWSEIKVYGRVDPTIIAKWARDGSVSDGERGRLDDYRSLRRSRIGVGCKDPANPPKRIAPNFEADGKKMCPVQRCTLCIEHAVIFPDSLSGLCKRLAELRFIQSGMSIVAFLESSFGEEITNTELALGGFDVQSTQDLLANWEQRIAMGEHRVINFDSV